VIDIDTRPGVKQRFLYLEGPQPRGVLLLYAGDHGGLHIADDGSLAWGSGNFLVRERQAFADGGFIVAVVDAPSDRQSYPYLGSFRETAQHAEDAKALIAWMRAQHPRIPVWLVGTSRGTESAAAIAIRLGGEGGPDGIVLTSSILVGRKERAVTDMDLAALKIPVLVVHHKDDQCRETPFAGTDKLMKKLTNAPRKELIAVSGGTTQGDPCEAAAYHGYNGIEDQVVQAIETWISPR